MKTTRRQSALIDHVPFYYGWAIAAIGTLGIIMTNPGQTSVISIFIDRIIGDLEISRSMISTLYLIGSLTAGLSLGLWGRQIDKYGPRVMMGMSAGLLGLTCLYMGFVQNAVMLGIGFILLRMMGAGCLYIVSINVINQWWVERRGTVIGISGIASSLLGMGAFPNLVNALIGRYGWQTTYSILGLVLIFGMVPLGLLLVRDRPEDYGLHPDGMAEAKKSSETDESGLKGGASRDQSWTIKQAIHTSAFWILAISFFTGSMLSTGLYFHMVDIFQSRGLSSEVAAAVYAPIAITSALMRLGSGYLADRIKLRYLLAASMLTLMAMTAMAIVFDSVPLAMLYGVIMGINGGLSQTVGGVVWAAYFGREHLGAIAGLAATVNVVGAAMGPLPLGLARDLLGSYNLALAVGAALPLALTVANLLVRKPKRSALDERARLASIEKAS